MEYSHRDRRAHRDVARGFAITATTVTGSTLFALFAPWALSGVLAVIALAMAGVGFVAWGERLLAEYVRDLRIGTTSDGFVRVEVRSLVELERSVGRPTERSPHSRTRSHGPAVGLDPGEGKAH
ncbi:MAG: hypothetical protein ABSB97_02795 [Thermoplasmata archaeon]|jgi:hypothetical protein